MQTPAQKHIAALSEGQCIWPAWKEGAVRRRGYSGWGEGCVHECDRLILSFPVSQYYKNL